MGLRTLYQKKKVPFVTIVFTLLCITACSATYIKPYLYNYLALFDHENRTNQYITFLFVHGNEPHGIQWMHLGMNLLGLLPFGILAEKLLGHIRVAVLFLVEWGVTLGIFLFLPKDPGANIAGISTVVYALAVLAAVCLIKIAKKDGRKIYKQPLTIFFLVELLGMLSLLNPIAMSGLALALHASGIAVGVLAAVLWNKKLDRAIIS
ncbi:MAG: rhomboid family intramembrane serine protease [Clostridiales bacterium]|nr:rhomboid family intramembrane serine protease [Clostridiales bacterium]